MKPNILAIILITFSLLLSACATKSAEDLFIENSGQKQLTSEQLSTILDGNTVRWADGSHVYYNGSEIRALDSDGNPMVGIISFENDLHCRSWGGGEKCSSVYAVGGDDKLAFYVDGKSDSSGGEVVVIPGNPQSL